MIYYLGKTYCISAFNKQTPVSVTGEKTPVVEKIHNSWYFYEKEIYSYF